MKNWLPVILLLTTFACSENQNQQENSKSAFFEKLTSMCGNSYHGESVYPDDPEHELHGADLVMTVAECDENEVRIPFKVNEDQSRTWVITYSESDDELLLKHDHRYPDGTLHDLTNYGGYAHNDGLESVQYFEADEETAELLPEASTNVWMMEINEEEGIFVYYLERYDEPRYRAEFQIN